MQTYSVLWGVHGAACTWWCFLLATAVFATLAAHDVNASLWVGPILAVIVLAIALFIFKFKRELKPKQAKAIEVMAAVWTIILYLSLGIIPGLLN